MAGTKEKYERPHQHTVTYMAEICGCVCEHVVSTVANRSLPHFSTAKGNLHVPFLLKASIIVNNE